MYSVRLTSLLLSPSVLSFGLSFLFSSIVLVISNWSYVSPTSPWYGYLFGEYGLTTVLLNSTNALSVISTAFGSPLAYKVAVLVVALFIGLLVYVFLEGIDHVAKAANEAVREVEYVNDAAAKSAMRKEVELRAGLRIATFVVWIGYVLFFAKVILPYAILLGRVTLDHLLTLSSLWKGFEALVILLIAFHIHVIFLRLLFLRPRIFGIQFVGRGGHEE